jgi:hypothetical protein
MAIPTVSDSSRTLTGRQSDGGRVGTHLLSNCAAKPYMKPRPGTVDVLTPEGVIMRIPAD